MGWPVGWTSLAAAAASAAALALPGRSVYAGIGLALAAVSLGSVGYRRRSDPTGRRLLGAAGLAVGAVALAIGLVRYGLALAAVGHIESVF